MKIDTFPYFPLDVTEDERKAGFREMALNLGKVSCIPSSCCRVVGRRLSETDVAIKWKGYGRGGEERIHYEHMRFGFRGRFLRVRWPWTKFDWLFLGHSGSPLDAPERVCTLAWQYVGIPFHECAV